MAELEIPILANMIRACRRCDLHQNRIRGVPGEGPVDADIVIIGEAPGKNENLSKKGSPFIGKAGRILDEILEAAKISRGDCFVTNMVKCWPGEGNPDPTPEEIEACSVWMDRQLLQIQPRGIITFGRFSTGKFLEFPKGGIGRIQGAITRKWWDEDNPCYIMPIYHPAYLGRSKDEIPAVVEYLRKFKEVIYG